MRIKKIFSFVLILLSLSSIVYAETYLYLKFSQTGDVKLQNIFTIENTFWNDHYFYSGIPTPGTHNLQILDKEGQILYEKDIDPPVNNPILFNNEFSHIILSKDNNVVLERYITFCNNNGLCEPCESESCEIAESVLTCSDCVTGSKDNYCDLYEDNICDPDCDNEDIDCDTCIYCLDREQKLTLTSCEETFNGEICRTDQSCTGEFIYADNSGSMCCVSGECSGKEREEPYQESEEEPEIERKNYAWLIYVLGIILIILILLYYIKKRNLVTFSLIAILVLAGVFLVLPNQINNRITGKAVSYERDGVLKTVVTKYYSPLVEDFSTWCSPTKGSCLTSTDEILNFYRNTGYYSSADNCINVRRGGWCCIKPSDRGFYEEVKCEGSGFTEVNGELKAYRYFDIQTTQSASPIHEPKIPARAGETVACPEEFDKGTKFYLDYGEDNSWTGCYDCTDRGAAIKIDSDGTIHLDLYVGTGVKSLQQPVGQPTVYYGCQGRETKSLVSKTGTLTEVETTSEIIPEELKTGEKTGFYYLNPSTKAEENFNLDVYDTVTEDAKKLINDVRFCPDSINDCITSTLPNNFNQVKCSDLKCAFEVNTGYASYLYNEDKYIDTPIIIKFALKFIQKVPDTKLSCAIDKNLDYFEVKDYGDRQYSKCIENNNKDVPDYLIEAFKEYPSLGNAGYTPLLLMTTCYAESKCIQGIYNGQGFCQIVDCPGDYPNCHKNTEEGKRENILAAAKLISNKFNRISHLKNSYGFSNRQMVQLVLFAYNRGEGTILGVPGYEHLNSTTDYLKRGESLLSAMLLSCYEAYDAGLYKGCGGRNKESCCTSSIDYVKGLISEYETQVCPNTEKVKDIFE